MAQFTRPVVSVDSGFCLVATGKRWSILILGSIDVLREVVLTNKPLSANYRLGPRRVIDVMVFVSHGSEKRKCRLRDISLSGAFIETGNFALAKDTEVDLVLRVLRGEKTTTCLLPAEVARVEKDGAALMFNGLDQHVENMLVGIVLASQNRLKDSRVNRPSAAFRAKWRSKF